MADLSPTPHQKGTLLLLLSTIIWGTSFPVLKDTVSSLSPAVLITVRFCIAAIALLPWLPGLNFRLLRDGALLGSILFLEMGCALIGLETISASRSAFIVGLNVVLVPLLGVMVGKQLPRRALLAAGLAAAGISLMSWEGQGISTGDWLTLVSATGIATYILLLEKIATRHPPLALTTVQTWVMILLGAIFALPDILHQGTAIGDRLPALIYLGIVVTVAPLWSQALGQRWVPAHEAALLYTLEPVFATFFSFWFLGERLSLRGAIGAACILTATIAIPIQRRN